MNCQEARQYLLMADDPRGELAVRPELAAHVEQCGDCKAVLAMIGRIEEAAPDMPVEGPVEAPEEFVRRIERTIFAASPAHHYGAMTWRRAAAAVVFLAMGLGALVVVLTSGSTARAEVLLSRLVDWNLQIAQVKDPAEKNRIYRARVEEFRRLASAGSLTPGDRAVAQDLVSNAQWLTTATNSVDVAEHFQRIVAEMPAEEKLTGVRQRVVTDGVLGTLEQTSPSQLNPVDGDRWKTLKNEATKEENNPPAPRSAAPAIVAPMAMSSERFGFKGVAIAMAGNGSNDISVPIPSLPAAPVASGSGGQDVPPDTSTANPPPPVNPTQGDTSNTDNRRHYRDGSAVCVDRRADSDGDGMPDDSSGGPVDRSSRNDPSAAPKRTPPDHAKLERFRAEVAKSDETGTSHLAEAILEAMEDEGSGGFERKAITLRGTADEDGADDDGISQRPMLSKTLPSDLKTADAAPWQGGPPAWMGRGDEGVPGLFANHGFVPGYVSGVVPEPSGLVIVVTAAVVLSRRRRV